jgi:hypothetical protein
VAADVGIQIENYEVVSGAIQDEVLIVVIGMFLDFAEDATDFRSVGSGRRDVSVSPWAPESFHKPSILYVGGL